MTTDPIERDADALDNVSSPVFGDDGQQQGQGEGVASLEGIANIYENQGFNVSKELLNIPDDIQDAALRSNLTRQQAARLLRLVAQQQATSDEGVDMLELIHLQLALSVATDGRGRSDVVSVAVGMARNAMSAAGGAMGEAWQKAKRW